MKNIPNGAKSVQGNKKMCRGKKCALGTKNVPLSKNEVHNGGKCNLLWHIMVLNCLLWPYMALYGLVWSCMVFCGLVHGLV